MIHRSRREDILFFWEALWGLHIESYRRDRFETKKCGRVGLCMFNHESGESQVKVRIPHCIKSTCSAGQTHHSRNLMPMNIDIDILFSTHLLLSGIRSISTNLAHCQAKLYKAIATVGRLYVGKHVQLDYISQAIKRVTLSCDFLPL